MRPLFRICQTSANPTCHRVDKGLITHIEPVATPDKFTLGIPGKRVVGVCSEVGFVELGHSKHVSSLDRNSAWRRGSARRSTGDPTGTGTGGSGHTLKAEFSDVPFERGTVGMSHEKDDPDSADSQFFIVFSRSRFLDGKYTVWGQVTKGMKHVGKIKRGDESRNGAVDDPDKIIRMRVAVDVK